MPSLECPGLIRQKDMPGIVFPGTVLFPGIVSKKQALAMPVLWVYCKGWDVCTNGCQRKTCLNQFSDLSPTQQWRSEFTFPATPAADEIRGQKDGGTESKAAKDWICFSEKILIPVVKCQHERLFRMMSSATSRLQKVCQGQALISPIMEILHLALKLTWKDYIGRVLTEQTSGQDLMIHKYGRIQIQQSFISQEVMIVKLSAHRSS